MVPLLNTSIVTAPGDYRVEDITVDQARQLVEAAGGKVRSFVGHPETAQMLSTLLGVEVPTSRDRYEQQAGETAIVFQINGRRPEPGVELTAEQIQEIGFTLRSMTRLS
jgi:hypothetical protein